MESENRKVINDKVTVCLVLPTNLYDRLRNHSSSQKTSVSSLVTRWIESKVSLQDVSVGLASMMASTGKRGYEPQVDMKKLIVSISRRHYNLLKMESIRSSKTVRALLKDWVEENTQDQVSSHDEQLEAA